MSQISASISALLPVKNGEQFLRTILPSILEMLNSSDELIIVNDGSTDDSWEISKKFQYADSRIQIINTAGIGLVKALNLGLLQARNEWVARFDVDDRYSAQRLVEQRKLVGSRVAVIFSDYYFNSTNYRKLGLVCSAVKPVPMALSLVSSQRTPHPVALINRNLLLKSGSYKEEEYPVEDLALWLRLSQYGDIVSAPFPLLDYRLSKGSISAQNRKVQIARKNEVLQSFVYWGELQNESLYQLEETLSYYKNLPQTSDRIYLHIRDIFLASRFTRHRVPISLIYRKVGIKLAAQILTSGTRLTLLSIIRRFYRWV